MSKHATLLIVGVSSLIACATKSGATPHPRAFLLEDGRVAVPANIRRVEATIRIDATENPARMTVTAAATIAMPATGLPYLDLVPELDTLRLDDDETNLADKFVRAWPSSSVPVRPYRVLDVEFGKGGPYVLHFTYDIEPTRTSEEGTVDFAFDMRDVVQECGGQWCARDNYFLERYLPATGEWDDFQLSLDLELKHGAEKHHQLFANGKVTEKTSANFQRWHVEYPRTYNASSFYLHVASGLVVRTSTRADLPTIQVHAKEGSVAANALVLAEDALARLIERFGPLPTEELIVEVTDAPFLADRACSCGTGESQPAFWRAKDFYAGLDLFSDSRARGMEYHGAFQITGAGEQIIAHETVHMWFGRGRRPPSGRDGWLDEGVAEYYENETLPEPQKKAPCSPREIVNQGGRHQRYTRDTAYAQGLGLVRGIAYCFGEQTEDSGGLHGFMKTLAQGGRGRSELTTDEFYRSLWCREPESAEGQARRACLKAFLPSCLNIDIAAATSCQR